MSRDTWQHQQDSWELMIVSHTIPTLPAKWAQAPWSHPGSLLTAVHTHQVPTAFYPNFVQPCTLTQAIFSCHATFCAWAPTIASQAGFSDPNKGWKQQCCKFASSYINIGDASLWWDCKTNDHLTLARRKTFSHLQFSTSHQITSTSPAAQARQRRSGFPLKQLAGNQASSPNQSKTRTTVLDNLSHYC